MINVIVSYQVKPEFVAENQANIALFLSSFEQLDRTRFRYSVYLDTDGVTFTHISHYQDAAIQQAVLNDPAFLAFQKKRDESGLNDSHTVRILNPIGSTNEVL